MNIYWVKDICLVLCLKMTVISSRADPTFQIHTPVFFHWTKAPLSFIGWFFCWSRGEKKNQPNNWACSGLGVGSESLWVFLNLYMLGLEILKSTFWKISTVLVEGEWGFGVRQLWVWTSISSLISLVYRWGNKGKDFMTLCLGFLIWKQGTMFWRLLWGLYQMNDPGQRIGISPGTYRCSKI